MNKTCVLFLSTWLFAFSPWAEPLLLLPSSQPTEATLIVHGLNNNQKSMSDIADFFTKRGSAVIIASLTGHRELDPEKRMLAFENVSTQAWLKDVRRAHDLLTQRFPSLKRNYVGYSMGAVLGELLMHEGAIQGEKVIYFQPALQVNGFTHLVRIGAWLSPKSRSDSRIPEEHRANRGIPWHGFGTFFELFNQFHSLENKKQKLNRDTLVFIDRYDELVSFKKTEKMIREEELSRWRLVEVIKDEDAKGNYHHVAFDEASVGSQAWRKMKQEMELHLGKD